MIVRKNDFEIKIDDLKMQINSLKEEFHRFCLEGLHYPVETSKEVFYLKELHKENELLKKRFAEASEALREKTRDCIDKDIQYTELRERFDKLVIDHLRMQRVHADGVRELLERSKSLEAELEAKERHSGCSL